MALPKGPEAWILDDLLPVSGALNIFGNPKSGKSLFSLQLADAISDPTIKHFLSFPIRMHGPVMYVQIDTPRGLWCHQINKHFLSRGFDLREVYHADREDVPYPFNILTEGKEWLAQVQATVKPLVVIIDTLREVHSGDENDSGHMKNVINSLVAAVHPAALVLISHARKRLPDTEVILMNENRGSSYVAGRMDVCLLMSTIHEDKKQTIHYQGRTIGETKIQVLRDPIASLQDPVGHSAVLLVLNHPDRSEAELAKQLLGIHSELTFEAARSKIRRARAG